MKRQTIEKLISWALFQVITTEHIYFYPPPPHPPSHLKEAEHTAVCIYNSIKVELVPLQRIFLHPSL